jgi:hypothetical protein
MEPEMNELVEVKQTFIGREPHYELIISRANLNYFGAGCPGIDRLVGFSEDGMIFYVIPAINGETPTSFKPLPGREGYYAYLGAHMPPIPLGATAEEIARQTLDILERAINESDRLPIEEGTSLGKINLGWVVMRVEKDTSLALPRN